MGYRHDLHPARTSVPSLQLPSEKGYMILHVLVVSLERRADDTSAKIWGSVGLLWDPTTVTNAGFLSNWSD